MLQVRKLATELLRKSTEAKLGFSDDVTRCLLYYDFLSWLEWGGKM
jgi:hypothetical protein